MKLQDKETNEVIEVEVRQVNDKTLKDRPITTIDGEEITLEKLRKKYVDYEERRKAYEIVGLDEARTYFLDGKPILSVEQDLELVKQGVKTRKPVQYGKKVVVNK